MRVKTPISLLLVLPVVICCFVEPVWAEWLPGLMYRRPVIVANSCGEELTDYQVRIRLDDTFEFNKAKPDGSDICFTEDDGTTLIPFWIEEWNPDSLLAGIWINIPSISVDTTSIYIYYGGPTSTLVSDGHATFDVYDGFESPAGINPGAWSRYPGNPLITEGPSGSWDDHGATFASVILDETAGEFRMYYHGFSFNGTHQIGLATSPDAVNWTKFPGNPVMTPGPTAWDDHSVRVPMVWKEGPSDYRMMYTGYDGSSYQIGYAFSADGISWTKHASNPVFNDPTWAHDETENWGVMKVGAEYLMWYCDFGMRQSGIAVSSDLVNWSPHQPGPIFASSGDPADDRYSQYCPFSFKYGGDYYVLVPSYDGSWNYSKYYLYRSSSPYFPESDRHLVRVAHAVGLEGEWDDHDNDCPYVFMLDIERTQFYSGQLWCYYAAEGGANLWKEGLLLEADIAAALSDVPLDGIPYWDVRGAVTLAASPVHQGIQSIHQYDEYSSGTTGATGAFSQKETGVVGAWLRRNSVSYGDYDIYLYGDSAVTGDTTLACVAGMGRDGDFHYWNGGFQPTGVTWALDTWYLITIAFDATVDLYDFVVFGEDLAEVMRLEGLAFGNDASSIDGAMLYTSLQYVGDAYADDFRIRKWCGSELVVTTESEELNPAVATPGSDGLPRACFLYQNYPNPFNPETEIQYNLPFDCHVRLEIYNILGQKVATLTDEFQDAGRKVVRWNGRDRSGKEVTSGVYFYRLKAGSYGDTKRMVLLK